MNYIILFCAEALIFIAAIYATLHIYFKHERKHHSRHIIMVIGTSVLAWVVAHVAKDIIAHPRPDLTVALLQPDSVYSFPSGHASFMFALAFTMHYLDTKAARILFALAILTGVARVLAGVHYWYDIVGGAVLGFIISWVVVTLCKRLIREW
ncbi:MAG: phosphatase PAP2 family protein [Candidatus Paceibacterota bacterium]